jgi:ADP-heptose:LPS heptosyltransferase
MTVPVINAFSKQHPQVRIIVVSRPFFKPMFAGLANVTFFEADLSGKNKGFLGLHRLYKELKRDNIDGVADLHNVLRSKIISSFFSIGGIKTATVDKARAEKKALVRVENKIFQPLKPITQRYADVFGDLGFPLNLDDQALLPKREISAETLNITGIKSGNWIGIAPFAKHEGKVYPAELMQQTINYLSETGRFKIFLFGAGKYESGQLDAFAQGKSNVINIAGRLSFSEELSLISNLDAMLSMDSGNAHLAAMFGVQTVTLWGSTHPYAGFAPFLQPDENAMVSDREKFPNLPTSIYGNKKVEGYEDAMKTISPESVAEKIRNVLKNLN